MKKFENNEIGIEQIFTYIVDKFGDISKYKIKNEKDISSIFLAGAPGSGKTEFIETIFNDLKESFIVINIDKYRKLFKNYNGNNSSEFQKSSVRVADKILKYCFKNNLNFVFDGTFRNYNKVKQNFGQCKKHDRKTLITLVFQDPRISFYYTFLRKLNKKRNVPIDVFIDGFYNSIFNIFKIINISKNINLMIAEKKYKALNKNEFSYNINYKIFHINDFCRKYRVGYKKGEFINKEKLKVDIERFNNILLLHFNGKGNYFTRIKIWFVEKIFKF